MYCANCGAELPVNSKFCSHCGNSIGGATSTAKTYQMKCKSCSGVMNINEDENKRILMCPFCGSKEIFIENDAVVIARIQNRTYKDVEIERQKTQREMDRNRVELEKSRLAKEQKMVESDEARERSRVFKKGKLSKLIIVYIVFAILGVGMGIEEKNGITFGFFLAIIQLILLIVSWIFGTRGSKGWHILPAITAIVLTFPYMNTYQIPIAEYIQSLNAEKQEVEWYDYGLLSTLPNPKALTIEEKHVDEESASVYVMRFTHQDFISYVKQCKESGYAIDSSSSDTHYTAYNKDNYELTLSYYEYRREIRIAVDAPMAMAEIKWPSNELVNTLPSPPSIVGNIKNDTPKCFIAYFGEITPEQYSSYVDACIENGFTFDYDRGDTYFNAKYKNDDGHRLSLRYERNNVMFLRIE